MSAVFNNVNKRCCAIRRLRQQRRYVGALPAFGLDQSHEQRHVTQRVANPAGQQRNERLLLLDDTLMCSALEEMEPPTALNGRHDPRNLH